MTSLTSLYKSFSYSVAIRLPAEMALLVAISSDPGGHFERVAEVVARGTWSHLRRFVPSFLDRVRVERAELGASVHVAWSLLLLFSPRRLEPR
jgi:hypothetical protein